MKSLPKVLAVFFITLIFSFLILPRTVKAQVPCPGFSDEACAAINALIINNPVPGPWYDQNPTQFASKVFGGSQDEIFGERYTYAQINWIINSIASMVNPSLRITNPTQLLDFLNALRAIISQTQTGQMPSLAEYSKLGPAGLFAGGVSMMYANPPASGVQEIKYTTQRILDFGSGVAPAHAQGYGFSGLNVGGVRALWTATRNMSYLIVVILLIASGFLIMFRVKINPQTVVSLQTMIPKLIITMLLITFSFAIAGFVIDLVYVAIAAFVGLLALGGNILDPTVAPTLLQVITDSNFMMYIWIQVPLTIILVLGILAAAIIGPWALVLLIIPIGLSIWALWTLWKIFWMLLKAYVTIILLVCVGPLQIMLDLIPGQKGFGPWFRNIIANASVFAVVPIMLLIQHVISGNFFSGAFLGLPPNLGLNTFGGSGAPTLGLPFLASQGGPILMWAVGFTIFAMTPKIAEMIREALKIPAFKYGGAVGEALGAVGWGYNQLAGPGENLRKTELARAAKDENWPRYQELMGQESWNERAKAGLKSLSNLK